jgi:hypothetical protein
MLRTVTCALLVAVLAVSQAKAAPKVPPAVAAEKKAAVEALKQQIAALRLEEKALVQGLEARFKALVRVDRLTEKELAVEREALRKQEEVSLALTPDAAAQKQIRAHYETLRGHLKGGVKLEEAVIQELKLQERAMVDNVRLLYGTQVQLREAQIRSLR